MGGPHGVRGEVRIHVESDVPGRFARGARVDCDGIGSLTVASSRGPADGPIVRFEGYGSREAAGALRNRLLRVPREEARRAAGEGWLWADLIGLAVVDPDGRALGTVREVLRAGGADVLVVRAARGELLLPMLRSVVREVDLAAKRIVAVPQEEL